MFEGWSCCKRRQPERSQDGANDTGHTCGASAQTIDSDPIQKAYTTTVTEAEVTELAGPGVRNIGGKWLPVDELGRPRTRAFATEHGDGTAPTFADAAPYRTPPIIGLDGITRPARGRPVNWRGRDF